MVLLEVTQRSSRVFSPLPLPLHTWEKTWLSLSLVFDNKANVIKHTVKVILRMTLLSDSREQGVPRRTDRNEFSHRYDLHCTRVKVLEARKVSENGFAAWHPAQLPSRPHWLLST